MITKELLKECRLEFDEYFQSLVTNSPDNQHKVEEIRAHSIRVSANALLLANIVLQTEGEKRIAELTGLFHDFGKASLNFLSSIMSSKLCLPVYCAMPTNWISMIHLIVFLRKNMEFNL